MKAFKRREVTDLQHLRTLVADNADAMEPDLKILASNLNFGRTSVELAALDAERVPVLFVLGLTADDAMLIRALEAYAWCLEYPESVQRLAPANTQLGWPPRIVFVAERLLEAFVRKMRLLNFSSVDCFEFRYVEANGTTGFYLDRVDWAPAASAAVKIPPRPKRIEPPVVEEEIPPLERPRVAPREEPRLVLLREEPPEELREELEETPEEPTEEPRVIPRAEPKVIARVPPQGVEPRARAEAARVDPPKNGASRSELPRGDLPKGGLAPTCRKFLDRLTSTFDARPTPEAEPPRADPPAPGPLVIQPSAADIEVSAHEVAPDEVIDESHESVVELTDKQRRALQGLTLPDNGELAPQWRKFLDHPALDETKIGVVRGYLQREFPLCTVYDFYDFQRNAQVFQLQDNHGKVTQLITMTAEFFDGHRDLEIRAWIEKHRLAQAMRQAGQAGVLVSEAGLQIEKH